VEAGRVTPDLTRWVTPPGALTLYEQYWSAATDAPREYIIPCGLSAIGTVISNRVYLSFGGDRIYPNIWQIILGPSSTYRKSTCVKQVRRTLARLSEGQPNGLLFPDEFSKEALVTRLSEHPQGLLTYSEFSGALAAFNRDYMSGIKELLADLYDSPPKYERLVGTKTITATNVCISMLAASQTDWLLQKLSETDIRGGYMARMTLWPAFYKRRFLAIPPEPDPKVGNELIRRLNAIRKIDGVITLPTSVRERYAAWLERHERELDSLPGAGQLSPFWSRMSITTLKMAIILHVASVGTLLMDEDALESAIGLTEFLKLSLAHLFNEELAFTPDMKNRQRVLQAIRRRPGQPFREISRACSLLKRNLQPVIETLRAEELIVVRDAGYWPVSESEAVSKTGTDNKRSTFSRVK
jgi:hypothetical protein